MPETAEPDSGAAEPVEPDRRKPMMRRIVVVLAPALIYLSIRQLGLLFASWLARENKTPLGDALTSWDGQWFLGIAAGGYDHAPASLADAYGNRLPETPLAFFPGYPMLVRGLASIDGPNGLFSLVTSAFVITIAFGIVAAYGLARLGASIRGGSQYTGWILVALFAASPMAIVLSMTYSEAMFCAFAVWALVGVVERKWWLAGLCCGLAGFVRPTGIALLFAVGLAVAVALIKRRESWRPLLAGLIAPVGLVAYLGWVASRTGRWDGWFALQQRGWDSGFDGGAATWKFSIEALTTGRSVLEVATVGVIVSALVLLLIGFRMRLEWPLLAYAIGVLVMDLGANGLMNSKARLLLPAFTLLIPIAVALAKRRPTTVLGVLAAAAVTSAWIGAYAITSWGYAI
ncbi:uncharacterized protein DUF2029 [Herbihabitans rhizosphaerae]|uniref:Uncharacterized protein DUF2029 n=1 Tax=Herbihabitans rhizosphaerae TaxID=1872711 RepID=A0A4Q7L6I0_9PSEU|nr:uncharacterized protein DUF2029 [Herbihabitans rhizosphaerae]